jgi:phosphopantothenoylcysteine decarboxylase/phosphopantothenate--cysteine ligase
MRESNASLRNTFLVGFAAETDNIEQYALKKMEEKKLDMICVNDVGRKDAGFGTETNIITIYSRSIKKLELPLMSKKEAAAKILDCVEERLLGISGGLITNQMNK